MKKLAAVTLSLSLSLALPLSALAQAAVTDPWVRATVPGQKTTGAFMQITSPTAARLVEARSPVAGATEVHETKMENGVMKMRPVAAIALPAGQAVALKPGSYHVMLMDLKRQVKEGETVPLTLVIEGRDRKRRTLEVKAEVRPLASSGEHGDMKMKH